MDDSVDMFAGLILFATKALVTSLVLWMGLYFGGIHNIPYLLILLFVSVHCALLARERRLMKEWHVRQLNTIWKDLEKKIRHR